MAYYAILPKPLPQQIADSPEATHLLVWYTMIGRMAWHVDQWQITELTVTGYAGGRTVVVLPSESAWHIVAKDAIDVTEIEQDEAGETVESRDRPRDANALDGWPGNRL